jgi:5'-nucleotidase/2',3'-cyclic-nucleotide 2'-phosphodiesterase/3'-nucleotidase
VIISRSRVPGTAGHRRTRVHAVLLIVSVAASVLALTFSRAGSEEASLALLHTSGLQGRFGQVVKAAALYKQIQREVGRTVLLDAGNTLSPSEEAFARDGRRASVTVGLLNWAGYGAWVPGDGEFGRSASTLTDYLRGAKFPVLAANLHQPGSGRPLFQIQPYTVIRTPGLRVGVLGLASGGARTVVGDPVSAASYFVPMLKQSSDVVVVLSHLGFEADSTLAASVPGIDVIAGCHSPGRDGSPRAVNGVLIARAEAGGASLSRVDITVSEGRVIGASGRSIPLDVTVEGQGDLATILQGWTADVDGEPLAVDQVLAASAGGFEAAGDVSAMGNLLADLVRISAASDVGLIAAFRVDPRLPEGPIRVLDLYRVYGWPHRVATVSIGGNQLRGLVEEGLGGAQVAYCASGLEVVYDSTRAEGARLISARVGGTEIEPDRQYRVALEEDRARSAAAAGKPELGPSIRDLLARHIASAGVVRGALDPRIRPK